MTVPQGVLWDPDAHTKEKHALLRGYLDAWWPIILQGRFRGATFAEGFSGPGEYTDGSDGSPVVAMRALLEHNRTLPATPSRFVFVEDDRRRADHLRSLLPERFPSIPAHVSADVVHGRCETDLLPTLDGCGAWGQPIFAFLDPFGVAVPHTVVRRIGQNGNSEVLITFFASQLTRWATNTDVDQGDVMFGDTDWRQVANQPTAEKRRFLIELYRERLKSWGFPYRLAFELVDEGGRGFFLVFGTGSLLGVEKMKDAMWSVDRVHGTRFRDPRDPNQTAFDIGRQDPDLRGLEHLLAAQLSGMDEVQVGVLRQWALESTVFRPTHVRDVLRKWRGKWIASTDNALSQTTRVKLTSKPVISPSPRGQQGMLDLPPA